MEFYNYDENICYCCIYNNSINRLHQDEYDDSYYYNGYNCNNQAYFQTDFYTHMENFLLNKTENFNPEILNINSIKSKITICSEKRLLNILDLVKENSNISYDLKVKITKCFLCWQSQFNDINLIKKIIEFNNEILQSDSSKLGDYPRTLLFSIHSHSLDIVQLMVENLGTNLDVSVLKYTIIENLPFIFKYILEKSKSKLNIDLIEFLIEISIQESKIECLKILIENSVNFKSIIDINKLVNICKYVSLKLKSNEKKEDLKLEILKLIFDVFNFDITYKIKNYLNHESLFSICFEFTEPKIFKYLLSLLYMQEKSKYKVQEILVDTLINKMKRSFECNINLIEILLNHINNKRLMYNKLLTYDKGRLIKPCENQLKNFRLTPPANNGYCKQISNSFFIKQQMLIKYDIIPVNKRIFWLANFIYYWTQTCSNRSSYVSASTILRFISIDEIIDLVVKYYGYLIANGFINIRKQSSIMWWFNLKDRNKMSLFDSQYKSRLETLLINLHENHKKVPLSLKMIARNRVRYLLISLSNECLESLKLPTYLVNYLRNDSF